MRPIKFRGRYLKFRGRDLDLGDYVYGEFGQGATSGEPMIYFYDKDAQQWVGAAVDPDSVAQLVGYDANGKEVYEGDTVLRYDSKEEFEEAPENGKLREVILYTQVVPLDDGYYCLLKGGDQ